MRFIPLLLLLIVSEAYAAPVSYNDEYYYNRFTKKKGDWNNPKNWDKGELPSRQMMPVIRDNAACTLKDKVPPINGMHLGGRGTSVLTVSEGADLEFFYHIRISRNQEGTHSLLAMHGGTLRAGAGEEAKDARLYIGVSPTFSSTGLMRIDGGTVNSGIIIGSTFPNTGVGTLSIVGSAPVVKAKAKRDYLTVTEAGNLEFVLDAEGIAPLDFGASRAVLEQGCLIRVDGTAYTGGVKTFPLIIAGGFANKGARTECVGFADNYKADIVFSSKGAQLRVRTK